MASSKDVEAGLLVIIGEPLTEDQTTPIVQRIIDGISTWQNTKCPVDLNTEILNFINKNPEAENIETGGSVIRSDDSHIYIEFLIAPSVQTLHSSLQNFLTRPTSYKHVIHAGPTFMVTGSWILRDGTFSFHDFSRILHRSDVATALTETSPNSTIYVSCFQDGEWTDQGVKQHGLNNYGNISFGIGNGGIERMDASCATAISRYVEPFVRCAPLKTLLPTANLVGSLRFRQPTIYIFPAGQGDAALFGVDGFLMVLDGGFQRKTCFWDFLAHVDHLDAIVISRLNSGNLFGVASFLDTLSATRHCAPKLGHVFANIPDVGKAPVVNPSAADRNPLLISLYEEGAKIFERLPRLGIKSQTCAYVPPLVTAKYPESITLYEKVGQGRLEMYILNPLKESKEYAEFVDTWKKLTPKFIGGYKYSTKPDSETGGDYTIPLINRTSMAVLIAWRPTNPNERIVRVLYPGSCPQEKVLAGLEKLKTLDFLKFPFCNGSLLEKKLPATAAGMKVAMLAKKPSGGKTAAELMAEGAKRNSVVSPKPSTAADRNVPSTGGPPRDLPLASPPPSTASPSQMQSPSQALSPTADSSVSENGGIIDNENGGGESDTYATTDGNNHHYGGYNAHAETTDAACAYEKVTTGGGGSAIPTSTNGTSGGDEIFEEKDTIAGRSPRDSTQDAAEPEIPEIMQSSLNPNARPFYPKHSQSGSSSGGSSPESVRKMDSSSGQVGGGAGRISACGGDGDGADMVYTTSSEEQEVTNRNTGDDKQDETGDRITSTAKEHRRRADMEDLRNQWGEPLGLPTLPAKRAPNTHSMKSNGPVKYAAAAATAPKNPSTAKVPSSKPVGQRGEPASKLTAAASGAKSSPATSSTSAKSSPAAAVSNTTKPSMRKQASEPAARKPSTAAATSAKSTKSIGGLKKPAASIAPCYCDLVYIPHQGNPHYCNVDFFKYVRAKYYVISSVNPPKETLDALLAGKKCWNCPDESVTIIPTYDSDTLACWMGLHKDELATENVDLAPSCARCAVNLEEPAGATCAAYRLEL